MICEAAWACQYRENCLSHGYKEHSLMHDCGPGRCLRQPQMYRSKTGRRRRIQCLEPVQATLKAQKRRDALAAFGT